MTQARSPEGFARLVGSAASVSSKLDAHGYEISTPRTIDARSSRLECFHGEGWVAAGDAAMTFDPLSSQGIFTALYSGLKAGAAVASCLGGDREALRRYDAAVTDVYNQFGASRLAYYSAEQRWPTSEFWCSRSR